MKTNAASPILFLRHLIDRRIEAILRKIVPASLRPPIAGLLGGGKRVRALITLLSCEAAGGRAVRALDAAAGIELLHAASLIHDDIMDRATLRRGRPAFHSVCGTNQAIVCGDYLVALAYEEVFRVDGSVRTEAIESLNRGYRRLCEGQLLEERANGNGKKPSRKVLLEIMEKKTASLIELAAVLGGLLGRGRRDNRRPLGSLARFGRSLGIAFQIQDDILDRTGDEKETGKNRLLDLRNKKSTYLRSGGGPALRTARAEAERYLVKALSSLRELSPSPARSDLEDFVKSMAGRRV
jgi:geranylgeranyl pyrophosphate synthase